MTAYHYLIIGNGAAGLSAAEIIRRRDVNGRITLVTNEPHLFYSRPGIAYYVLGQLPERQLIARSESFYRSHRLNLRFGSVTHLDLNAQLAFFDDGQPLAYDILLLATGASAVPPPFPGGNLKGVLTFDNLADARRAIHFGRKAKEAVVIGGGITAMELAEGLHHRGARTRLLQRGDRIWPRLFNENESAIIARQIRHEGLDILYNEEAAEILGKRGQVAGIRLKSGRVIKCQAVGVAIGVRPNLGLVKGQPIRIDRGILVNEFMQSNVSSLFAAGDVAQVYDRWTGEHKLDILWPSAINEGRVAGYNMVDVVHGRLPGHSYVKSSPFNAALLFGVHLTVIGRVGNRENGGEKELSYHSRGSSQVWTAPIGHGYSSAWDRSGASSLRIVMNRGRLVGALLLGNQELADPLRRLIEHEADLGAHQSVILSDNHSLPESLYKAWRDWHQNWEGTGVKSHRMSP